MSKVTIFQTLAGLLISAAVSGSSYTFATYSEALKKQFNFEVRASEERSDETTVSYIVNTSPHVVKNTSSFATHIARRSLGSLRLSIFLASV